MDIEKILNGATRLSESLFRWRRYFQSGVLVGIIVMLVIENRRLGMEGKVDMVRCYENQLRYLNQVVDEKVKANQLQEENNRLNNVVKDAEKEALKNIINSKR